MILAPEMRSFDKIDRRAPFFRPPDRGHLGDLDEIDDRGSRFLISGCRENLCFLAFPLFFNSTEGKEYGWKVELPSLRLCPVLFFALSSTSATLDSAEGRNRSSLPERRWNAKERTSVGVSW